MQKQKPEAIMTNIPVSFFLENRLEPDIYVRFYVGQSKSEEPIFYHFISTIPVHDVVDVFICFSGKVQFKCKVVEFMRNKPLILPTYQHKQPRNWMVTGGPVVLPPHKILQPGFRGFRYTKMLF